MDRIIDRLDRWMDYSGKNDNRITVECGLAVGLLNKARSGKSDLGKKAIEKILKKYQNINPVWLLTGEGEMVRDNFPDVLIEEDNKAPLKRILQLLSEEDISLEEFAKSVNSHAYLFNNALKWPVNKSTFLLSNDSAIRGWVDSFCEVFPQYSKLWILFGKGDKYSFVVKGINEINQRISEIELRQKEEKDTLLRLLNHLIKEIK